jgi:hypothetical protein
MRIARAGGALAAVALALLLGGSATARAATAADSARTEPFDLQAAGGHVWQTGALAPDKLQHFSLAFSIGLAFGVMTGEPAATGGAVVLAFGKEVADRRHGGFSGGDLLAGVLGAGCAYLVSSALER